MSKQGQFRTAAGIIVGCVGLAWVAAFAYQRTLPDQVGPGQCEGLGFGCVPSPYDGMGMFMGTIGLTVSSICIAAALILLGLSIRR